MFWFFCNLQAAKNARLEKFEIPAKIKLLFEPWTPKSGLVTAALKLKREIIRKTFGDHLARLYDDEKIWFSAKLSWCYLSSLNPNLSLALVLLKLFFFCV